MYNCFVIIVVVAFLFIGLVIYRVMTAPLYVIRIKESGLLTYEDEWLKLTFKFGESENLRVAQQIPFALENKNHHPLRLDWDGCAFVDPSGNSRRVIHSGVKFISRDAPQAPSAIASRTSIQEILIPADNIVLQAGQTDMWSIHPLFLTWSNNTAFDFKVLLSVSSQTETKHYEITFSAVDARAMKKPM